MKINQATSRTLAPSMSIVAVLAVAGVLPLDPALRFSLVVAMAWAIAVIGLDLFVGYTGQVSFGHAAFVALGAYLVSVLRAQTGLPTVVCVAIGVLGMAAVAVLLGAVMVRLRTFGIAVTTFFFAYVVVTLLTGDALAGLTGGASGLMVPDLDAGGTSLTGGPGLYALAVLLLAAAVFLTCNLADSRTGRALRLIKSNEAVAAACGVQVTRAKVLAFAYCCALAALGGFVYSLSVGYLSPDGFTVAQSVYLFAMVVIGGTGTVGGPILGALLLVVLPEYVLSGGHLSAVVFAAVLLVFLVVLPDGLFGLATRAVRALRRRQGVDPPAAEPAGPVIRPRPLTAGAVADRGESRPEGVPTLAVRELEVRFGAFVALTGAALQLRPRSVHAVVGPNGAGKTTLLNALSGLQPVAAGSVELDGAPIDGLGPAGRRRRGLIRCFQTPALVPDLDVLDNVKLGLYADRRGSLAAELIGRRATRRREAELTEQAHWALEQVGVPTARHRMSASGLDLSEQKRVEIARGIVGTGRVLLLDEPTAGLSGQEMDGMRTLLTSLREQLDLSILVISHHIGFLTTVADEMTVLDYGQVVGHGEPTEVLGRRDIAQIFAGIEPAELPGPSR
ncbi:branched-chain amino acid ABC transporter ATP-binding protein/permease [Pseudonocardia kunmingensis]|uniref:Amino acid/amide ABC transporter membrane protein 2 (HAAT family) /amino acid/amide ABC transporter ATP-binding protein 1 (HAAT family) n=1 Tax=Pseudonocardia kunmingensis TaxID=630975 RepID=A0A543DP17_9PSEU|nr:ATP-binding cassette domain-containing protein [Pseudonocardia kunmingensis]TQM11077.1 amino acid/amide ABC transporter membrane protein 2 (HAAT family) /amino acid/amide ABC transporter ATP-binding protein 1 (HAAT family) [Pseudonocardia kunmingensis]